MSYLFISVNVSDDNNNDNNLEEELKRMYESKINEYKGKSPKDSGLDLFVPQETKCAGEHTRQINHYVTVACYDESGSQPLPVYLYPRSSISKTPLRLANSVGIIDAGYRGPLIAMVDNKVGFAYTVDKGTRLFQICSHNLLPFKNIEILNKTDPIFNPKHTSRGIGGFGSTGV
jgi:dUTP pyrophosphatase